MRPGERKRDKGWNKRAQKERRERDATNGEKERDEGTKRESYRVGKKRTKEKTKR